MVDIIRMQPTTTNPIHWAGQGLQGLQGLTIASPSGAAATFNRGSSAERTWRPCQSPTVRTTHSVGRQSACGRCAGMGNSSVER